MADILYKELSYALISAAMEVHRVLGAGSMEAVYQKALAHELTLRGIGFEQFKKLPVRYKGVRAGEYEADLVIEGKIILEIKAVSKLHPQHEAQAINYLKATGFRLAVLLNASTGLRSCFGASSLEHRWLEK